MTGLVKAKKYDWKDSNLALFGSDTERNVSSLLHSKKILKWFRFFLICVDLLGILEIQNTARRILRSGASLEKLQTQPEVVFMDPCFWITAGATVTHITYDSVALIYIKCLETNTVDSNFKRQK